jgi:hypothetical protein
LAGLIEHFHAREAVQGLPVAALLVADDGNTTYAVELIGLLFGHPDSITGWLEEWSLWSQICQDLEIELGSEAYATALERGKTRDLHHTIEALIIEFTNAEVS